MNSRLFLGAVAVLLSASSLACGAAPTGRATDAAHANAFGPDEDKAYPDKVVSLTSATKFQDSKLVDGPLQQQGLTADAK